MAFWKRKNQDRFISLGINAAPMKTENGSTAREVMAKFSATA